MERKRSPRDAHRHHKGEGGVGAVNLPFLHQWFIEHIDHPFPTQEEENELAMKMKANLRDIETKIGLSSSSVSSRATKQCQAWFINARSKSTWTEFYQKYAFSEKAVMTKLVSILKGESENTNETTDSLARLWWCGKDGKTRGWFGDSLKEHVAKCKEHWMKIKEWQEQPQRENDTWQKGSKPSRKDSRRFSEETLTILLDEYERNPHYENHLDRDRIAKKTGLKPRQVTVWFQNRRSRSENPPLKEATEKRRKREQDKCQGGDKKRHAPIRTKSSQRSVNQPVPASPSLPVYDDDVVARIDRDVLQLRAIYNESFFKDLDLSSQRSSSIRQDLSPDKYLLEPAALPEPTSSGSMLLSHDMLMNELYSARSPLTYLDPDAASYFEATIHQDLSPDMYLSNFIRLDRR
ncbi:uncharacterized protein FA14DRAFT_184225 [Meira miltonrushii]|uniref:Homeobox domain-containing protein n=1 Tax=Meira miltonrushii TaxID=1280837 RepID=A0A316VBA1_9BASI|nr:uncharacterized protein FA14DRAFT_184225 [Meira miltonrushii]PWN34786.1 hypothetical protein FA14DRAFT_184225 [Meira miltonrushii]